MDGYEELREKWQAQLNRNAELEEIQQRLLEELKDTQERLAESRRSLALAEGELAALRAKRDFL